MPLINYKLIHTEPVEEDSTTTSGQILQEKQERENNFRRALAMANTIIDNNPMVLAYYWYLWSCRDREYPSTYVAEQVTRELVGRMPVPTQNQQLLLHQHIQNFTAVLFNDQVIVDGKPSNACTYAKREPPFTAFSRNIFDITDDNDRWFFVAMGILHELVHCFEPVHVDLEDNFLLYCSPVNTRRQEDVSLGRVFEQGEIFEIMMWRGIVGRIDQNTLQWQCSGSDKDFHFVIDQHQYRHFFVSYDLTIIRNIIKRKKRRVRVLNYIRSIRQRINNFFGMFEHQ